ncbi:hypothetical protein BC936DRAFT_137369 [Jimgerdemannia flammicorona]|uniref:Uncharacterized protein n=1 Tax=Jimgerdemannia flammicorona TaxID=994334 RepID=A0A433DJ23_9FUNG|nr:hypothetical protein BC936DRAFT_137369 [Jimgerdemannia flammicorona]
MRSTNYKGSTTKQSRCTNERWTNGRWTREPENSTNSEWSGYSLRKAGKVYQCRVAVPTGAGNQRENEEEPLYQRALAVRKVLGPEHPDTDNADWALRNTEQVRRDKAAVTTGAGNPRESTATRAPGHSPNSEKSGCALQWAGQQNRCTNRRKKVLAPEHPDRATTLNLAGLYKGRGKYIRRGGTAIPTDQRASLRPKSDRSQVYNPSSQFVEMVYWNHWQKFGQRRMEVLGTLWPFHPGILVAQQCVGREEGVLHLPFVFEDDIGDDFPD